MLPLASQLPTDTYWAAVPKDELPKIVRARADMYWSSLTLGGYLDVWRRMHQAYYGNDDITGGWAESTVVTFSGADGERVMPRMNEVRSLIDNILSLAGNERAVFVAKAISDRASALREAPNATGVIQQFWQDWSLEERANEVDRMAVLYGIGFHHLRWSVFDGKKSRDPQTGKERREGDCIAEACAPWRVVHDIGRTERLDWAIVSHTENVWTLCARYPMLAEDIKQQRGSQNAWTTGLWIEPWTEFEGRDPDDVTVWCVYHRPTDALPQGRYSMVCGEVVLHDGPAFMDEVSLIPMVPVRMDDGRPFSPAWELMVPQELVDAAWSNQETNNDAAGVRVFFCAKGSGISEADVASGRRWIECDVDPSTGRLIKPEFADLLGDANEQSDHIDDLRQHMQRSIGTNNVARGEPEASLKSGAALALMSSLAVQSNSKLQASKVLTRERVATLGYRLVKKFAVPGSPRLARRMGSGDAEYLKEVEGDQMEDVHQVQIEVGSALMAQPAGRLEIANDLLAKSDPTTGKGMITTPQQYLQIIETGRLDPLLKAPVAQLNVIAAENDGLTEGRMPNGDPKSDPVTGQPLMNPDGSPVMTSCRAVQDHATHAREHAALLTDEIDPKIAQLINRHILDHLEMWSSMPAPLAALTGQSLPPPPRPMAPGLAPPQEPPGAGGGPMKGGDGPPTGDAPEPGLARPNGGPPPPGGPRMPINPATGERAPVGPGAPPTPV